MCERSASFNLEEVREMKLLESYGAFPFERRLRCASPNLLSVALAPQLTTSKWGPKGCGADVHNQM